MALLDPSRRWLSLALLLAFFAGSAPARAESRPISIPDRDARRAARARQDLFRKGVALLQANDVERALEFFLRSREAQASAKNIGNAAICLSRLGRYDEALEMYEELLLRFASDLDAEDRATLVPAMAALRDAVGGVNLSANVNGLVVIDGRARGKLPFNAPVRVLGGKHTIRIFKEGYVAYEARVDVPSAPRSPWTRASRRSPAPACSASTTPPTRASRSSSTAPRSAARPGRARSGSGATCSGSATATADPRRARWRSSKGRRPSRSSRSPISGRRCTSTSRLRRRASRSTAWSSAWARGRGACPSVTTASPSPSTATAPAPSPSSWRTRAWPPSACRSISPAISTARAGRDPRAAAPSLASSAATSRARRSARPPSRAARRFASNSSTAVRGGLVGLRVGFRFNNGLAPEIAVGGASFGSEFSREARSTFFSRQAGATVTVSYTLQDRLRLTGPFLSTGVSAWVPLGYDVGLISRVSAGMLFASATDPITGRAKTVTDADDLGCRSPSRIATRPSPSSSASSCPSSASRPASAPSGSASPPPRPSSPLWGRDSSTRTPASPRSAARPSPPRWGARRSRTSSPTSAPSGPSCSGARKPRWATPLSRGSRADLDHRRGLPARAVLLITALGGPACSAPPAPPAPPARPQLTWVGREPDSPPGTEGLAAAPCARDRDLSRARLRIAPSARARARSPAAPRSRSSPAIPTTPGPGPPRALRPSASSRARRDRVRARSRSSPASPSHAGAPRRARRRRGLRARLRPSFRESPR